jgi:hypothetical protein
MSKVHDEPMQGAVFIVEASSWVPTWLGDMRARFSRRLTIEQLEDEAPVQLAERANRELSQGSMLALAVAVLACNARTDAAADSARRSIVAALVERMSRSGGHIILTASERDNGSVRRALSDIASEWADRCQDLARGRDVSVSVRFGSELPVKCEVAA